MSTSPLPSWDHGQRRTALVESLLAEIFNGTLQAGQHLVAQDLADRHGVSQTPIREALITLAGIGVIDLLPNRGAIVRPVTVKDVQEVCRLRRVLECEATRTACKRIPEPVLDALIHETRQLPLFVPSAELLRRAREIDSRIHDTIAAHCGNSLLAREIGRLKLLFRAYRDVSWNRVAKQNDFTRLPSEVTEHVAILNALKIGNRKAAAKAMSVHIRSGEKYWTAVFAQPDGNRNGKVHSLPKSLNRRKRHR